MLRFRCDCHIGKRAGGITWACAIGFAYYYIGSAIEKSRGPLDIVLGVIALLVVIASLVYLHKAEDRYATLAEQAFPRSPRRLLVPHATD